MAGHLLKTWTDEFEAMSNEIKNFEIRFNDRDFFEGDILVLAEYDKAYKTYTGRYLIRVVEFMLDGGKFGLEAGYVCMSITKPKTSLWTRLKHYLGIQNNSHQMGLLSNFKAVITGCSDDKYSRYSNIPFDVIDLAGEIEVSQNGGDLVFANDSSVYLSVFSQEVEFKDEEVTLIFEI